MDSKVNEHCAADNVATDRYRSAVASGTYCPSLIALSCYGDVTGTKRLPDSGLCTGRS